MVTLNNLSKIVKNNIYVLVVKNNLTTNHNLHMLLELIKIIPSLACSMAKIMHPGPTSKLVFILSIFTVSLVSDLMS
jgi:hypothetical protein